jgi:hypothetical protein
VSTAKAVVLRATDVEGSALTYAIVAGPGHGTVSTGTAANRTYTPTPGWNGTDTFTFKANDGAVDSNVATVTVKVDAVPVAVSQAGVAVTEDVAKAITLVATDADGGDTLTYTVTTAPLHGVLSGVAPNVTYTPVANYKGADSFAFKANDGSFDSVIATVGLVVGSANDAPVAQSQSVVTKKNTAKAVVLVATDVDLNVLTYAIVTPPVNGVLTGTGSKRTYTPGLNYTGADSFTFKASDGTTDSNVATVSITVASVNDPPVANPQSVVINEDVAAKITLTVVDPYLDAKVFQIVTPPAHGTLTTGTTASRSYKPALNYNGPDSFAFRVQHTPGHWSEVALVRITVLPVDDKPVAVAQAVTTPKNTAKAVTLGAATDVDGEALTYTVVVAPLHGTVTAGTGAARTYTPTAGYIGADSFTFKAYDGKSYSAIVKVTITVTGP